MARPGHETPDSSRAYQGSFRVMARTFRSKTVKGCHRPCLIAAGSRSCVIAWALCIAKDKTPFVQHLHLSSSPGTSRRHPLYVVWQSPSRLNADAWPSRPYVKEHERDTVRRGSGRTDGLESKLQTTRKHLMHMMLESRGRLDQGQDQGSPKALFAQGASGRFS